ncbi:MAG: hypothetical protein II411_01570 [Lachnospiraceae bacterium]|nr:hypothetical protein [Lachnospiraceae bacterium]
MYKLSQIKLNINHSENDLKRKIAKAVKVSVDHIDWSTLIILHKSIDARVKSNILFVYNVAFNFAKKFRNEIVMKIENSLEKYEPVSFNPYIKLANLNCKDSKSLDVKMLPQKAEHSLTSLSLNRPVVVGFGPAGIFASYIFVLNGLKPIIVERGKSLDDRIKDVEKFFEDLELNEDSNVCFGEGGAGAFSDGKLNTNNKDKTGVYHFVLETLSKFGADEKILYENMPHIGTDKLVNIIKNIRNEIIKLGGEIYYSTKLIFKDGIAKLVYTNDDLNQKNISELHECNNILKNAPIILAIGNSSRDTFRDLIANGFDLKPKPFAIGYRIAHKQFMIDEAQYGIGFHSTHEPNESKCLGNNDISKLREKLGPANYKLTYDVGNGHSVYSFCMCPGGYIINSSNFKNMLSINGMSYNDRSGKYANSAIVETISPEDVLGTNCQKEQGGIYSETAQAIKMIEFQEMIEKKTFELEKGFIPYLTNSSSDICIEDVFKGKAKYCEKLKTVFDGLGLKFNINDDIEKALQAFNKIINGFYLDSLSSQIKNDSLQDEVTHKTTKCSSIQNTLMHYIIAGVETRTSSPVKLDRDENYMCNVKNFYPCGEGLGHGGGIMSCAVDGIRVAVKIIENYYR